MINGDRPFCRNLLIHAYNQIFRLYCGHTFPSAITHSIPTKNVPNKLGGMRSAVWESTLLSFFFFSFSETGHYQKSSPVTPMRWGNGQRFECGWSGSLWFCSSPRTELAARLSAGTSLTSLAWRECVGWEWINDVRPAVLSQPLPVCV